MSSTLAIVNDWYQARYGFLLAAIGLILLAFVTLVLERRQDARRHKAQLQALKDFVFAENYFVEVQKRYPHLVQADIALGFEQLRVYFLICLKESPQSIVMPSKLVDMCWHTFILDTRAYQQFCSDVYGKFLHHQPHVKVILPNQVDVSEHAETTDAQNGESERQAIKRSHLLEAARVYQSALAMVAPDTHVPPLFEIDEQMRIADGFIYSPEMLKFLTEYDLKANESSAAYSDLPALGVICADLASCSDGGAAPSGDGCSGSD